MNATQRLTLTLEFPVNISSDPSCAIQAAVLDEMDGTIIDSIVHDGTIAQAMFKLKARLYDALRELADSRGNCKRRVIATIEGTIFLVEWRYGHWGYSVTGPGRSGHCSCPADSGSFTEVCEEVRRHAASNFDGIAWETSF